LSLEHKPTEDAIGLGVKHTRIIIALADHLNLQKICPAETPSSGRDLPWTLVLVLVTGQVLSSIVSQNEPFVFSVM